ncbi:MAG: type II CAAX prenyl endopeptidase Rce1 family protein [Oceanicaulis sp.]
MSLLPRTASSLLARAASRLARRPAARDWAEALGALAVLAMAGAGLARGTEALKYDFTVAAARAEPGRLVLVALVAFVIPALGEELVFRGLFQPMRLRTASARLAAAASLAAFIAWHPLQVALALPSAQPVFLEPAFLAMAGLLGLVCTVPAHRSGSLWTAVFVHWAVVAAWKAGEPFQTPPGAG